MQLINTNYLTEMEILEETVGIMEDYGTFKLHLVNVAL